MIYLNSFLFCGIICLIGEIILDNTKLTPGHITSIFVSIGAILSFLGIYDIFKKWAGVAASIPITSFGHCLYQATISGYHESGILGMFSNMFSTTSLGISSAIIIAFLVTLVCKPRS